MALNSDFFKVFEEAGVALGYALGVFDRYLPVAAQRRDRHRHGHAVVVVARNARRADFAAADAHDVLFRDVHFDTYFGVFFADRLGAVALLVQQPRSAADRADAVGRRGEGRKGGEEVGAVGGVEFEAVQRAADRRHRIGFVDDGGAGPDQRRADGRVGLLREHRDIPYCNLSGDGAGHQQHGRRAPVALDAQAGRAVTLAAFDVELFVIVMADFHAETGRGVYGHVQIRGRNRAPHMDRGVVSGQRQRQHESRDELRRNRAVHVDLAAADRSADFEGQESAVVAHPDAQRAQRSCHHLHRAAEQRALAFDGDRRAAERSDGGE